MIRASQVRGQYRWTEPPADATEPDGETKEEAEKLQQTVEMRDVGPCKKHIKVSIERESIDRRLNDKYSELVADAVAIKNQISLIKSVSRLIRVAWHLGNRHLPTQIMANALRIRRDHVIEAMVRGLGARVIEIEAPFDPEGGAYADAFHAHAPESDSRSGHDHPSHEHSSDGGEHRHHDGHDHLHRHSHAHDHK